MSLISLGDAGGCPGGLVQYEGQCLCPQGMYPDPRPQWAGVCFPYGSGRGLMNVGNIVGAAMAARALRPDQLMPGSVGVPSDVVRTADGGTAPAAGSSAPASRARLALWLGIGGVVVVAGVLLLRRR